MRGNARSFSIVALCAIGALSVYSGRLLSQRPGHSRLASLHLSSSLYDRLNATYDGDHENVHGSGENEYRLDETSHQDVDDHPKRVSKYVFTIQSRKKLTRSRLQKEGFEKEPRLYIYKVLEGLQTKTKPCAFGDLRYRFTSNLRCKEGSSGSFRKNARMIGTSVVKTKFGPWLKRNPWSKGWVYAPLEKKAKGKTKLLATLLESRPMPEAFQDALENPIPRCMYSRDLAGSIECENRIQVATQMYKLLLRLNYIWLRDYARVLTSIKALRKRASSVSMMPFTDEEESSIDEMSKYDKICLKAYTWFACLQKDSCSWKAHRCLHNREVNQGMQAFTSRFDWDWGVLNSENELFFVYQPSGGLNNQRMELEYALLVCALTNRSCILPPAARHTNRYEKYNALSKNSLASWAQILDFDALASSMSGKDIRIYSLNPNQADNLLPAFVSKAIRLGASFSRVDRDQKRWPADQREKLLWSQASIINRFVKKVDHAKILYFEKATMWGTWRWKEGGILESIRSSLTYSPLLQNVARKMSAGMKPYAAVHIRRGDWRSMPSFDAVKREPEWYINNLAHLQNETNGVVYVASDAANIQTYIALPFQRAGWKKVLHFDNLPGEILAPLLKKHFPRKMDETIIGIIEQLLCSLAQNGAFLGSSYSTFSLYILQLRRFVYGHKSTCRPHSNTFSGPC